MEQELIEKLTVKKELKNIIHLAGPFIAMNLAQFLLQGISVVIVGHLGELALSSTAISISLCNVTGFSFLLGMASALETLAGQSYGAGQFRKFGSQIHIGTISMIISCIPISILWLYLGSILENIGQDHVISEKAGTFAIWYIPALFGYGILQPIIRYFQMQSMIYPLLISSSIATLFHLPVCWALVFKFGLESYGAAIAMGLTMWLHVIVLYLFMYLSPSCEQTRFPLVSMEAFTEMKVFFRFAIPSAVMVCLEWWSYELIILSSGFLPSSQLETSVLTVCINILTTFCAVPWGLAGAVSTRVSNELGAENPEAAKVSVKATMLLAVSEVLIVDIAIFSSRHVFGYLFSNEEEVVNYVANIAPLVCLSVFLDGVQGTLAGVARGCGWQHLGAYVNLASFYVVGIPIGIGLAFGANFKGTGLWIGIVCGAATQSIMLSIITYITNWEEQAAMARERMFPKPSTSDI